MRRLGAPVASATLLILVSAGSALAHAANAPLQSASALQVGSAISAADQSVQAPGSTSCLVAYPSVAVGVNTAFAGSLNTADVVQVLSQVTAGNVGNPTITVSP